MEVSLFFRYGKWSAIAQAIRRNRLSVGGMMESDRYASILLIPLFTLKITTNLVKQAMESIRFIDVTSWIESIFGSSMLSQRRNLKSAYIFWYFSRH
ncbi:hypothetical protein VB711_02120 [Cronbergia sp. UHCC 0137]|uniref:hypothetical protein n=1 Tax=Cronbergia sp. UHCC 0137 TaxID=3110239 RepID=UPI002B1F389A|nr:hypothetical protein [Cronbergia sp. UHCC 0137]MEA5616639.1 hypothetical protein [Cronbergia sp. UHCC 0137]